MRFISLEIKPLGDRGWESSKLHFGQRTTLLFAKNGSGKTPIIQSLAYCLGFPSKFRDDILGSCSSATLRVAHHGEFLEITRIFHAREFHSKLNIAGVTEEYFSEGDFSIALFRFLQLEPPLLVSTNKQATQPYIATVLPLFYLNQGDGYTTAYKSPNSFIEDQFVEMVRFIFGLNPRHSYAVKKDILGVKESLESANRQSVTFQRIVNDRSRTVDDSEGNQEALRLRAKSLTEQIDMLRASVDAKGTASSALTDLVRQKDVQIRRTQNEIDDLRSRVSSIETIRSEIDGEIQTLGLNEESRRVFMSVQEICRIPNCGLFIGSSESYGKNLLYLRDQIKDLERNSERAEIRHEFLEAKAKEQREERAAIAVKLDSPSQNGVDEIVSAVHALTRQLVETENERASIEALKRDRSKLFNLELERSRIHETLNGLTSSGRVDLEFNKLRARLRELAVKWMDILDTSNVSRNIDIDLELRFRFNGEGLELFSGSTKIRLVLAIHAALFEEYVSEPTRPFRFIILDTPKQQELQTSDLAEYLNKLEEVCSQKDAQMILSSTEYKHPTGRDDEIWLPTYEGVEHPMYLGTQVQRLT